MKSKSVKKILAKMLVVCMSVTAISGDVSIVSAAGNTAVSADTAEVISEEVPEKVSEEAAEEVLEEVLGEVSKNTALTEDTVSSEKAEIKAEEEVSEFIGAAIVADKVEDFAWSGDDLTIINGFSDEFKLKYEVSEKVSIVIPEKTSGIVSKSFDGNGKIESIDFSKAVNLEVIMSSAFRGLGHLKNLDFSVCKKLTRIKDLAFYGCSGLENVKFNDTLQYIETSAYEKCTSIREIVIPEGVISIGTKAFYDCTVLTSVAINTARLTDTAVGTEVFGRCKISDIRFENPDMTIIPKNMFNAAGFSSGMVVRIPAQVTDIGESAFASIKAMYSVEVASTTLKSIKNLAFSNSYLTDITFNAGNPETIGANAFSNCALLTTFDFKNVKYIYDSAFENCILLGEISLPDTVELLGNRVFKGCLIAEVVRLPKNDKIASIPQECFHGCGHFRAELWNTIDTLESGALAGVGRFTKVVSGLDGEGGTVDLKYIKTLGNEVFLLSKLEKITIPETVKNMGTGVFKAATKLKSAKFENDKAGFGETLPKETFAGCESLEEIIIPENIEVIDEYAFGRVQLNGAYHSCDSLTNVKFSDVLKKINKCAFNYCRLLSNLDFPHSLTSIGEEAFSACESLINVVIPEKVVSIGTKAFFNDAKIKKLVINAPDLNSTGKYIFTNCNIDSVTLPENMKIIPDYMLFMAGYSTEGVTIQIPDTVSSIGISAFAGESTQATGIVNITGLNFTENSKLKVIKDGAFAYCSKLTALTIPQKVETIGKQVFLNDVFDTMIIPENVTSIGDEAFKNCQAMRSIIFKGTILTSIGNKIFEDCSSLTSVDLPAGLGTIGSQAFMRCANLTHIYVPSSVVTVGDDIFKDCNKVAVAALPGSVIANKCVSENTAVDSSDIAKITYVLGDEMVNNDAANTESFEKYSKGHDVLTFKEASYAGFKFEGWFEDSAFTNKIESTENLNEDKTIYAKFSPIEADESIFIWDESHKTIKGLTGEGLERTWIIIPKCTESIGPKAFLDNKKINAVNFEKDSNLRYIRDEAFSGCIALRRVNLTNCKDLETIGKKSFYNCTALGKAVFNDDLVAIGENAFENCKILKEIELNYGLKTLSNKSFSGCEKLSKLVINSTDLTMASTTNSSMTEVTYDSAAFNGCALSEIVFGKNKQGKDVDRIPPAIFANATFAVSQLSIPEQISSVGIYAFAGSGSRNKLEKVDFSAMKSATFNEKVFEANNVINTVIFPDSLERMPERTFYNATKIDNVIVPSKVESIGKNCFYGATGLTNVVLPEGLKVIEDNAFTNTNKLTLSSLPSTVEKIGAAAFNRDTGITLETLPANLKYIGQDAFNTSSIKAIDIPEGVTHIGRNAFKGCSDAVRIKIAAKNISTISANVFDGCVNAEGMVEIPESVNKIDAYAFNNCVKLTGAKLPAVLTEVGNYAFYACPLKEADFTVSLNKIGQRAFYGSRLKTVVIPENVTSIADEAFATDDIDNAEMTSLTFNAKKMGTYGSSQGVFRGREIKALNIGNEVTVIPVAFLKGSVTIADKVVIPASVTKISDGAFAGTGTGIGIRNIKAFEFAENSGLTEIGKTAFQYTGIKEIVLPEKVATIGILAFSGCSDLRKVTFSKALTQIPAQCFHLSSNLEEVVFKQSPTTMVNSQAFAECTAIRSILLPGTVTQLATKAFDRATSLETLFIPKSVTAITADALNGCDKSKLTIYTVSESAAYKFAVENGFKVSTDEVFSINYNVERYFDKGGANPTCYFIKGEPVVFNPGIPTRSGYIFDEWYLDAAHTKPVKSTEGMKGDIELYMGYHIEGKSSSSTSSKSSSSSTSKESASSTSTKPVNPGQDPPESAHGTSTSKSSSSSSVHFGNWDIKTLSINKVIEVTANISTKPKIYAIAGDTVSVNVLGMVDYETVTIKSKAGASYDKETHHVKLGSGKDTVKVMRMVNGKPKPFLTIKAEVPEPKAMKLKMGKSKKIKLRKSKAKIDGYIITDNTVVKVDTAGNAIPLKSGSSQISAWINGHEFVIPVTVQ